MTSESNPAQLAVQIKESARNLGFDLVGVSNAATPETLERFESWRDAGFAGEMSYLERRQDAYRHPDSLMQGVRSIVVVGLNYATPRVSNDTPTPGQGRVSCYAWGTQDYHTVLRERLRQLADALHHLQPGCRTRAVVDTAPLLERDVARRAGLGWFGKNTMLINRRLGSWFFLGAVLTDVLLEPDEPHATAHCGTCTRCLDACPTDAFVAPYVLDARKCISYLTIELRGRSIPEELRPGMGDWLFGCDVCQDVCPWNRKAPVSEDAAFQPRADLHPADCATFINITDAQFRDRFGDTPLARPGRSGMARNACIVLGNHGDRTAVVPLTRALADADPVVREAAAWALQQLENRAALESDAGVDHTPCAGQAPPDITRPHLPN
ncbi:MAG: tRNA epoxyqueuosine(34) reductase QueG [Planctomycetaceae bacterium]|nr:tRNA epoxyqueuosine(34) reductase QueG [Planctomycetaceae bacterium]